MSKILTQIQYIDDLSAIIIPSSAFENEDEKKELLKDKILICDEISSGIVPLKKEERLWREETGKVLQFLSKESEEVYRIFFGIGTRLKGE